MKKIIFFSFVCALFFSNCQTLNYNGKKPVFLVDAPGDLIVKCKGKQIEIKEYAFATQTTKSGNTSYTTKYYYTGILVKIKRRNSLQFISQDKSEIAIVKGNPAAGILWMLFEAPFTIGIGTIVDLATTSYFYPNPRIIDVKACLEGTKPRTKSELKKYISTSNWVHK